MATFTRTFSDFLSFSPEVYTPVSNHKFFSDNVVFSQNLTTSDYNTRFNDSIFFSEAWRVGFRNVAISDFISIQDSYKNNTPRRSFADVFVPTDFFNPSVKARSLSDSIFINQTLTATTTTRKNTDILSISDSFTVKSYRRPYSDTINLTDSFKGFNSRQNLFPNPDILSINDFFTVFAGSQRYSQALVITDSFTFRRPLTNVAISQNLVISAYFGLAILDKLNITDNWIKSVGRNLAQTLPLTQSFAVSKVNKPLSQFLPIHQTFCVSGASGRGFSDGLVLGGFFTYSINTTGDSVIPTVNDTVAYVKRMNQSLDIHDMWSGMPPIPNCETE